MSRVTRRARAVVIAWGALLGLSSPQAQGSPPLAAFAARPGASLVWSTDLGTLSTATARATFTVVAYEDLSGSPSVMRGLRIALEHLKPDADCFDRYSNNLCHHPKPELLLSEFDLAVAKAEIRWNSNWRQLIFGARDRVDGVWVDVIVGGFMFANRTPAEVLKFMDQATSELAKLPDLGPKPALVPAAQSK